MNDEPKTLTEWRAYLREAARVPQDSPDYADAREAVAYALQRMHNLTVAANVADAPRSRPVSGTTAAGVGLMQGLSLGFGEPIAGALSAVTGGSSREGAGRFREGLENVQVQHPATTHASEFAGMLLLPAGELGGGLATIKAGVPLTVGQGVRLMARGVAAGAIPGAIAGFSAGGDDPGDIDARLSQGKKGAILGGLIGGIATGLGARLMRRHVEKAADLRMKGTQRATAETRARLAEARLRRMTDAPQDLSPEDAFRQQLIKAGVSPENVDAQIARQQAGPTRIRATELPIEGEVAASLPARPGETMAPTPGQPRGFEVTGPRKTPAVPTTPSILEMQQGITRDPVAQQIARQGMGSPSKARPGHPIFGGTSAPTRSPEVRAGEPLVPSTAGRGPKPGPSRMDLGLASKQMQTIQEALANASPEEIPGLLANLKDMGILNEAQVTELLGTTPRAAQAGVASARLSIRPTEYRGQQGFSVTGTDGRGHATKIFATTREIAERIKAKVLAGGDIGLEDFNP